MSKNLLSIFRKGEVAKAEDHPSTGLESFLYGPAARPAPPELPVKAAPPVEDLPRAKLTLAFDATSSREAAWRTSTALTDAVLAALPGQLDVNLAVHGGNRVHTFTRFESDAGKLRDRAAGVRCKAGHTRLLDILGRVLETEGVKVVVYIGDTFEESEGRALKLAAALKKTGTRLIILHDTGSRDFGGAEIFAEMAAVTGGAVLPFNVAALPKLCELVQAVAVLAVGDVPLLQATQETMPAARLLLQHLKGEKP